MILDYIYIYIQFYDISNLMPNFIIKNFIADFLSNLKVVELEHGFEPGDLVYKCLMNPPTNACQNFYARN